MFWETFLLLILWVIIWVKEQCLTSNVWVTSSALKRPISDRFMADTDGLIIALTFLRLLAFRCSSDGNRDQSKITNGKLKYGMVWCICYQGRELHVMCNQIFRVKSQTVLLHNSYTYTLARTLALWIKELLKVAHHRCQVIAFMFNGGSCSSFTFYPIDTKICRVLVYYWASDAVLSIF